MAQNTPQRLLVEMRPIKSLKPDPKNPRRHSKRQIRIIADSIKLFGFTNEIITDDDDNVIAGHGRLEAAKLLGMTEVPCKRLSNMSKADLRAYNLAENRIAELSGWDMKLRNDALEFLVDENFDLTVTGFELTDLDFTFKTEAPPAEEPVEIPSQNAIAVSQMGDLWFVGPHRLYCGDSQRAESYEMLLQGELAQIIVSDAPYNVPINGHVSGLGQVRHREFAMATGEKSDAEFVAFLRSVFKMLVRFSAPGSIHYQFMDWRHISHILDAAKGVYTQHKQLVVWNKTSGSMGSFYRSQHELVFVFKSGRAQHINNFGLGETGRYRTNVWTAPGANVFSKSRQADLEAHPTVKPWGLIGEAILDCSNPGGLVLDPFSGSGTTLIAAHRTGRRGAAIEIDPLYVDTALRRLEAATGLEAIHADGETFAQKAQSRATNPEENI